MRDDSSGVVLLGLMLSHLAEMPALTVSELAAALDMPRSTTFCLVGQLEAAGLVDRDAGGRVSVGAESSRLGFASVGLGCVLGHAEALIPVLRDDTDATASLLVRSGDRERVLLRRRAPWDAVQDSGSPILDAPLAHRRDAPPALIRLHLRPHAGEAEQASARASLARTAEALSKALLAPSDG